MKRYQCKEGPYPVRLVYEPSEIDDICEGALREARFLPKEPAEINIDGFLEKFFGVHVLYEDLGEGILGSTVFASTGRVTGILISSRIEEDGSEVGERRARSTLAHEGGHGLLHPQLFMEDTPRQVTFSADHNQKEKHPKDFSAGSLTSVQRPERPMMGAGGSGKQTAPLAVYFFPENL